VAQGATPSLEGGPQATPEVAAGGSRAIPRLGVAPRSTPGWPESHPRRGQRWHRPTLLPSVATSLLLVATCVFLFLFLFFVLIKNVYIICMGENEIFLKFLCVGGCFKRKLLAPIIRTN
jgi:hypothetical protein